jgi:hypothetical protein
MPQRSSPNAAANRASAYTSPSSSRIRIARFPLGDDARAIRVVSSGTSGQGRGCTDMTTPSCGQAREEENDRTKIIDQQLGTIREAP